jgi:hypothetical protein
VPLIFKCAIPYLTKPIEEYGTGQGVAGLTFVEIGVGAAVQIDVIKPVEHEQRSFNTANFPQRPRQYIG